jgi:hypothetical protein
MVLEALKAWELLNRNMMEMMIPQCLVVSWWSTALAGFWY